MNIYIPSKGRPSCPTAKLFPDSTIFVEPEDFASYMANGFRNIVVLPESNKGISYVRNYILKYAKENGDKYFGMVDDDLTGLNFLFNGKNKKIDSILFMKLLGDEINKLDGRGIIGLQYGQFMAEKYTNFTHCDVFVVINTVLYDLGNRYDDYVTLKEDRDFTMQCISKGKAVTRINFLGFNCPANGSNAGGLKDVYSQSGREITACERFKEKWSKQGYCEIIQKDNGRIDLKINYRALAKDKGFKV
jgi:glycosyltransferase involved in cell wall biosynthesis